MALSNIKVLFIDLENKHSEIKTFPDLKKYIGGVALGFKLYELYSEHDPIIFAVGPLNGFFPFVSKTAVILETGGILEDLYLGGYLSTRIKFADLDAIVLLNRSQDEVVIELQNEEVKFGNETTEILNLGLPGKKSLLEVKDSKILIDEYFAEHEDFLFKALKKKRVRGMVITSTKTFIPEQFEKYKELYDSLVSKSNLLKVERGFFPSCSGCPMGCEKSKRGELGGNVLAHSLVACGFAENIYADVGIIFSCLNVLGYDYTHEDIENLPLLVQNTLRSLS